jgi:two-component system CheB/CheR fusion protein
MTTRKKQPTKEAEKKTTTGKNEAPVGSKSTKKNAEEQRAGKQITTQFPIVGIGASAGGLEAFEAFFTAMPEDSDMAFVLVAHLDPGHASILPELVQKKTKMKVCQVGDNMKIEPNRMYIIPPNKEMAVLNGSLQLLEMRQPRGLNLPIDTFFRSLAQDHGNNAICIVLSGTGTDGTLKARPVWPWCRTKIRQNTTACHETLLPPAWLILCCLLKKCRRNCSNMSVTQSGNRPTRSAAKIKIP